jgi:hypothetical protein
VKWWGRHLYLLSDGVVKEGENELEIRYTTTLANYPSSLTSNEAAQQWAKLQQPDPMRLSNDVRLLKSRR